MRNWISQRNDRRLALLVAGTLGMSAVFACPPYVDMSVTGVEIGSSIAYAAEAAQIDVSTWDGKVAGNQTVTKCKRTRGG